MFDAKTDIAIIHVDGLQGPALQLETGVQERGTVGAALGYPGNKDGEMVVLRAAVQAQYPATGKDIYGRTDARREVYELRAAVRQGDSGGPFVLSDGTVAGVVFAASTTDGGIGYALTGAEVQDEINEGRTSTNQVSTGTCTQVVQAGAGDLNPDEELPQVAVGLARVGEVVRLAVDRWID